MLYKRWKGDSAGNDIGQVSTGVLQYNIGSIIQPPPVLHLFTGKLKAWTEQAFRQKRKVKSLREGPILSRLESLLSILCTDSHQLFSSPRFHKNLEVNWNNLVQRLAWFAVSTHRGPCWLNKVGYYKMGYAEQQCRGFKDLATTTIG